MRKTQLRKALGTVVTGAMKKLSVPGVSVGILHEGEELSAGFGVTSIEHPQDVDQDTLFQIGSTTKTFTATMIMRLVDEGRVELGAPVVRYLPKFRLAVPEVSDQVTVQHLLTHTGGWLGDYFDDLGRGDDALRRIVARMAKQTPQLTPLGEVWSYNNSAFYVAGRLIETMYKKSYETAVTETLLAPLGMQMSFFFAEEAITHKVASGHRRTLHGNVVVRPWALARTASPAGGIISTAPDQLRWALLHLGDGTSPEGPRILSSESVRAMQQPLAIAGSMADHVGVSWLLEDLGEVRVVKHGGTTSGQMSAFVMVPERDFAITVLTNGDRGHELDSIVTEWALREVLGVVRPEVKPRRVSKKARTALAGTYGRGPVRIVVSVDGDDLLVETRIPDHVLDENPDAALSALPPMRLVPTGDDRGVIVDEPLRGRKVEFVKAVDGEVEWIRWGGRITPRSEADEPAPATARGDDTRS